jgi:hypothetical protein
MTALKMTVDKDGEKRWFNQAGQQHRLDGPAIERRNGFKEWYQNGWCHRLDGPAIERRNGFKAWYQNGLLHRLDGPAMEWPNGDKEWFQNGADWPEGEAIYLTTEITLCLLPLQLPAYVIQWILEWVCPEVTHLNQVKLINLIQGMKNFHKSIYAKGRSPSE